MGEAGSASGVGGSGPAGAGGSIATGLPAYSAAHFTVAPAVTDILPFTGGFGMLEARGPGGTHTRYEVAVPAAPSHTFILVLACTGQRYEVRAAGRLHHYAPRRGDLMVLPAGHDSHWHAFGARNRLLHLHVGAAWLDGLVAEEGRPPPGSSPPLLFGHRSPDLATLMAVMRDRVEEMAASRLLAEHWAMTAVLLLLRLQGLAAPRRRAMSPARLARLQDHIEANLAERLELATLAAVAGLSRFHLARAFRLETGETLHGYVMRRRCERAKRLLLDPGRPLADIALACGFAHQAHFTTAFGRLVGTTPGRWRQERLP